MKLGGVLHPKSGSHKPTLLTTTYTFKINQLGKTCIPAAQVEFVDITHYNGTVYSNCPLLTVQEDLPISKKTTTKPTTIPTETQPEKIQLLTTTSNQSNESSTRPTPGFTILTSLLTLSTLYPHHMRIK